MAKVGAFDDEPAATLLVPYFEVDLSSPTGRSTKVSVRATNATAMLTHVTLWTDEGVPVFGFDIYLTGFDVQTFDVRDVLNGTLPATASAGQDPSDAISHHGPTSQDINFASCTGTLPPAALSSAVVTGLQNAFTGQASTALQGKCGGRALGDNIARGFITIDSTNQCTQLLPNAPGYFVAGGSGVANNLNGLTGHFALVDPTAKTTRAFSAAHLQATTNAAYVTDTMTARTFYSKLLGTTADQREPLGTFWSAPYRAGASVIAWRDVTWPASAFDCGSEPAAIGQSNLYLFDQQELATDLSSLTPFPAAASRTLIGSTELPDTNRAGLVVFSSAGQAWLGTLERAEAGEFAAGLVGTPVDNAAQVLAYGTNGYPPSADFPVTTLGTIDRAPASTLLLPYFEVDLDNPNGANTLVRFGTASASSVLANITLWTDLGVPSRSFSVYLTGYDQAELDLRLLFGAGLLHRSASAGQDPNDLASPKGGFSQDINFASCTGQLPPARLTATQLTALQNAHLGKPVESLGGKCAGSDRGDRIARGYITIDQVNSCTTLTPTAAGYASVLEYRNLLAGDWSLTNRAAHTMFSEAMVPIHARYSGHPYLQSGSPTFYGRLHGWNAADTREALPSQWEVPFDESGTGKTSLVVWREPDVAAAPFACGSTPPGQPGAHASAVAFDEQEQVTMLTGTPFANVSTMVAIGAGGLDVPYQQGVIQLDLGGGTTATGGPTNDPTRRGGFVLALRNDATGGTGWVQNGHRLIDPWSPTPTLSLIEVSQAEGFFKGGSGSATFKVRLKQTPTDPVTVSFSSSSGMVFNPTSVTLSTVDANGVTVTVTGATCLAAPNTDVFITTTASSADPLFDAFNPNDTFVSCSQ